MIATWRRPDLDLIRIQLLKRDAWLLTSVHPTAEKFYFRSGSLVFTPNEAVALVDAFHRIDREYLCRSLEFPMQAALSSITYACPTDQSAHPAGYNYSQWVRGRSSARICQDLFHTLICNKVDAGTDGISNYVKSAFPRFSVCASFHPRRCKWKPEYRPPHPRCLTRFCAVFQVPKF